MIEPSIESFFAKQVNKSRLMVGSLAGILTINLLVLGIASWLNLSRISAAAIGSVETSQGSPALPVVDANVVAGNGTAAPTQAGSQPAAPVESSLPAKAVVVDPVPLASLPPALPPSEPLVGEIQEAIKSLKTLLAQAGEAFSEIPFAAPASPDLESQPQQVPATPVQPEEAGPPVLCLVNPSHTGGEVRYTVDGTIFSLRPGEYHELPRGAERRIEFHRGDDFGYAQLALREGIYVFAVGSGGWSLEPGEGVLISSLRRAN